MTAEIAIANQTLLLHPSGAAYWQEQDMLLIADVHLGKIAHFRKHGAALPIHAAYQNLQKLTEIVNDLAPKTVCFLGDLFHSDLNREWDDFSQWVQYTQSQLLLIAGNHDIISPKKYTEMGITVVEQLERFGVFLSHHPTETETLFNIAGHIHPGVRLRGLGRQSVTLPCFFLKKQQLILPAFGTFTGKYLLAPSEADRVFAIVEGEVMEMR
jgi:DNA ligase-associated metallophosphoesterase